MWQIQPNSLCLFSQLLLLHVLILFLNHEWQTTKEIFGTFSLFLANWASIAWLWPSLKWGKWEFNQALRTGGRFPNDAWWHGLDLPLCQQLQALDISVLFLVFHHTYWPCSYSATSQKEPFPKALFKLSSHPLLFFNEFWKMNATLANYIFKHKHRTACTNHKCHSQVCRCSNSDTKSANIYTIWQTHLPRVNTFLIYTTE